MEPVISVTREGISAVVKLSGTVRTEETPQLQRELMRFEGMPILLDWQEADYIDASVLQVLLAGYVSSAQRPGVIKDNPRVREYLDLSGLSSYFPLSLRSTPDQEEALNA